MSGGEWSRGNVARMAVSTTLGEFEVVASEKGLRSVTPLEPGRSVPLGSAGGAAGDHARAAAEWLCGYAAGERTRYGGSLDLEAPAFHLAVWDRVRGIPFGATATYGEIAATLGTSGEAQAVGAAVAANPACILIPCHRVVGADGSLKGFAWGVALKRRLLAHEGSVALPLFAGASDLGPRLL